MIRLILYEIITLLHFYGTIKLQHNKISYTFKR